MTSSLNLVTTLLSDLEKSETKEEVKESKTIEWYNKPNTVLGTIKYDTLTKEFNGSLKTNKSTDFWFTPEIHSDNGHFGHLKHEISGDFEAMVEIFGNYNTLYDQMGLMFRINNKLWIKFGIEYINKQYVSTVVCKPSEYCDWNVSPLNNNPKSLWIKMLRMKSKIIIQYSYPNEKNGLKWNLLRKFYFSDKNGLIGIMSCSPKRGGFEASFKHFSVKRVLNPQDPIAD